MRRSPSSRRRRSKPTSVPSGQPPRPIAPQTTTRRSPRFMFSPSARLSSRRISSSFCPSYSHARDALVAVHGMLKSAWRQVSAPVRARSAHAAANQKVSRVLAAAHLRQKDCRRRVQEKTKSMRLRLPVVRDHCALATSVLALKDRSWRWYETAVHPQSYSVEPGPQRPKLPVVRNDCATPILLALLSAGSGTQEPLSDPLDARINDFLMWCGQRAVQVGQKGLPVSCIFRRSPGVAVALQVWCYSSESSDRPGRHRRGR